MAPTKFLHLLEHFAFVDVHTVSFDPSVKEDGKGYRMFVGELTDQFVFYPVEVKMSIVEGRAEDVDFYPFWVLDLGFKCFNQAVAVHRRPPKVRLESRSFLIITITYIE